MVFIYLFLVFTGFHVSLDGLLICCAPEDDLEHLIFCLHLSKCWDYRYAPLYLVLCGAGIRTQGLIMLGMYTLLAELYFQPLCLIFNANHINTE